MLDSHGMGADDKRMLNTTTEETVMDRKLTDRTPEDLAVDALLLEAKRNATPIVRAETVEVGGIVYPRCDRARGIARCGGWVSDGSGNCGGH